MSFISHPVPATLSLSDQTCVAIASPAPLLRALVALNLVQYRPCRFHKAETPVALSILTPPFSHCWASFSPLGAWSKGLPPLAWQCKAKQTRKGRLSNWERDCRAGRIGMGTTPSSSGSTAKPRANPVCTHIPSLPKKGGPLCVHSRSFTFCLLVYTNLRQAVASETIIDHGYIGLKIKRVPTMACHILRPGDPADNRCRLCPPLRPLRHPLPRPRAGPQVRRHQKRQLPAPGSPTPSVSRGQEECGAAVGGAAGPRARGGGEGAGPLRPLHHPPQGRGQGLRRPIPAQGNIHSLTFACPLKIRDDCRLSRRRPVLDGRSARRRLPRPPLRRLPPIRTQPRLQKPGMPQRPRARTSPSSSPSSRRARRSRCS